MLTPFQFHVKTNTSSTEHQAAHFLYLIKLNFPICFYLLFFVLFSFLVKICCLGQTSRHFTFMIWIYLFIDFDSKPKKKIGCHYLQIKSTKKRKKKEHFSNRKQKKKINNSWLQCNSVFIRFRFSTIFNTFL